MPPTDHRHAKAVKLALTQIDANLNRYDTTQKQIRMLRDLTDANELKMHPKGSGSEDLTAEKYHAKMQSLLTNHSKIKGTKRKGGPTIISQLFAKGSAVIDHEYLDQIGYERPPVIGKIQARTKSRVDVFAKGDDADKLPETQQRPQMPTTAPSSLQIARNHLQSAQRPLPTPTETSSPKISESDNTTATKRNEPYSLRVSSWSEDTLSEGGLSDDNTSEGATSESDLSDYEFREDASTIGTANEEGPSDDTSGAHDLTGDGLKEPPAESHHNADMASARDPDIADEKQMPSPAASNNTAAMDRESEGYSTGSAAASDDDPKDTGSTSPLIERTTDLLVTDDSIAVDRLQPSHDTYSTQVLQQRQRIGSHHEAKEHNTNMKRKSADSQRDATISKRRRIESENRNISTIPASSRSHEDALTDPKKPRQIEPVATSLIRQHLDTIKSLTRSFAIDVIKDLGVDPMGAARLVVNPTQELEALYQTVFGDKWEHQAFRLYLADDLRAYEVLQSFVTAAWFDILFQNKLGLPDAEAMIQGLIKLEPHANIVSERHSSQQPLYIRTLIWHATRLQFQTEHFKSETIKPAAELRARKFMLSIVPRLRALVATGGAAHVSKDEYWRLTDVFAEAMMLKGLMMSSHDEYEHAWVQSGAEIDAERMQQPHESDRPGKVKFCVCPAVWVKEPKKGECISICKAEVLPMKSI